MWTRDFWDALGDAELEAHRALDELHRRAIDEGMGCDCTTCVIRTVLHAVWPTLTAHAASLTRPELVASAPIPPPGVTILDGLWWRHDNWPPLEVEPLTTDVLDLWQGLRG